MRRDAHGQEADVVGGFCRELGQQLIAELVGRLVAKVGGGVSQFGQVFVEAAVATLDQAVGVQKQRRAGRQWDGRAGAVLGKGGQPEQRLGRVVEVARGVRS